MLTKEVGSPVRSLVVALLFILSGAAIIYWTATLKRLASTSSLLKRQLVLEHLQLELLDWNVKLVLPLRELLTKNSLRKRLVP